MDGANYIINEIKPERQDVPMGILSRQRLIVSNAVGVNGTVTCIGVPAWADNHTPAKNDSNVVTLLMQSGCKLIGKAQDDDFGISISGQNPFLSTLTHPINPALRIGGSASGSAVAIAKGEATIAVGNNCCGGVLIPASNCNLFGYRPSAGMIDLRGVAPLAPSFDAVGLMSKNLPTIQQIAEKCWKEPGKVLRLKGIRCASSLFRDFLPIEDMLEWEVTLSLLDFERKDMIGFNKLILKQGHNIHNTLLGREVEIEYGEWLDKDKPHFSDETAAFLEKIRGKTFKEFVEAKKKRELFSQTLKDLLVSGEVLMIPTTPGAAPEIKNVDETYLANQRQLYSISEMGGLAQLTIPFITVNGAPMGVSLLALPKEDKLLFEAARRWFI